MKKPMSTFIFILIAAGIVYLALFHKPQQYSITELQNWFSSRLSEIAAGLDADIEKDKQGEYPHAGRQSFDQRGSITYLLRDKNYARFDISDKNALSAQDIMATEGYHTLQAKVAGLGLSMKLEEKNVEGDGVNTFNEIDEYIDDFPRYYAVTVSGW
jgi:hypothetical protein